MKDADSEQPEVEPVREPVLSPEEEAKIRDMRRRGMFKPPPDMATIIEWKIF